jgi:octaprenyl-diphosphate synthase
MLPFLTPVEADFAATNALILRELHSDVGLVENIGHYIVESGGKRLRPLLVLLCAKALSPLRLAERDQPVHKLAAIIEFIHTATLLHDDVVDVSSLRRNRPTANAQWGNAPAVLVGDFLYSRAFQLMVQLGNLSIMQVLADTTNCISEGEVQQLVNARNPDLDEAGYRAVIHKKTGVLFEAACDTAARLVAATEAERLAVVRYGHHLGMAFQLIDDALDYDGDAANLGKNLGDDLAEGKATLPLIVAMRKGPPVAQTLLRQAILDADVKALDAVLHWVTVTGAADYTRDQARIEADAAIAALAPLAESDAKTAMIALAHFAVARNH